MCDGKLLPAYPTFTNWIGKWALIRQSYINALRSINRTTLMQFTQTQTLFSAGLKNTTSRGFVHTRHNYYSSPQCRYHRQALYVHSNQSSFNTVVSLKNNTDGWAQAEGFGWSDHGPWRYQTKWLPEKRSRLWAEIHGNWKRYSCTCLRYISGFVQLLTIVGNNFPLEIVSKSVECKWRIVTSSWYTYCALPVPELQGEPQDVAKEKCLMATNQVCKIYYKNQYKGMPHHCKNMPVWPYHILRPHNYF